MKVRHLFVHVISNHTNAIYYVTDLLIQCSAVTMRSSGSMNADRDLRGPCSTDLDNPTHYYACMIAVSSSYYEMLHIACVL